MRGKGLLGGKGEWGKVMAERVWVKGYESEGEEVRER